jgi:predicted peptidase
MARDGQSVARKTATKRRAGPFTRREIVLEGVHYPYQVFRPRSRRQRPPIILFLHGSGERGDDGEKQVAVGIGPALVRAARTFPAIVVLPQAPRETVWAGAPARAAVAALDATMAEFSADADRVYMTGVSMGGYGTWEIALEHPDRFAALVPICGGLRPLLAAPGIAVTALAGMTGEIHDIAAAKVAHIPSWIFHGSADKSVPVEESRAMAGALERAGAAVRYTEYRRVGHISWDRAYAEPELWAWLWEQRRGR